MEAVRSTIHYGTREGMPGWGVATLLSAQQMTLVSRYLREAEILPPDFGPGDIDASHKQEAKPVKRPGKAGVPEYFASLLHDVGAVLLVDAKSKEIVAQIETNFAPHDVAVSKDQQFLYALSRSGEVTQIDLWAEPPRRVRIRARDWKLGRSMWWVSTWRSARCIQVPWPCWIPSA